MFKIKLSIYNNFKNYFFFKNMVLKNLHIKENEKKLGIIFGVFFGVAS
jgi:hypothetical protein